MPALRQLTLENYRCFRERQSARLAPLTLLVGENSTGKTSFLAMMRTLAGVFGGRLLDFKEEPYDLGSFDEIAHFRGGRGGRAGAFKAGFEAGEGISFVRFETTFVRRGTTPVTDVIRFRDENGYGYTAKRSSPLRFRTPEREWCSDLPGAYSLPAFFYLTLASHGPEGTLDDDEETAFRSLEKNAEQLLSFFRPFASAPVRSKPHRTYDPGRATRDSWGDYVPMFLANESFEGKRWDALKSALEHFGQEAGLFDEIVVKALAKESGPFQLHVRRLGKRTKGPRRNLIDVGYGVSQVLPVVTELLRHDAPSMFLLQQPEVHLHPSAQAALGTLFCNVASNKRQLLVETHSDYLLDRVRMEIRDRTTKLKPKDVSILYFERDDLDVRIHSLRIDKDGNIVDAPAGYRRFFMEETARSIWPPSAD